MRRTIATAALAVAVAAPLAMSAAPASARPTVETADRGFGALTNYRACIVPPRQQVPGERDPRTEVAIEISNVTKNRAYYTIKVAPTRNLSKPVREESGSLAPTVDSRVMFVPFTEGLTATVKVGRDRDFGKKSTKVLLHRHYRPLDCVRR